MNDVAEQRRRSASPEIYMHLTFFVLAAIVIAMSFSMKVSGTRFVYMPGSILPMPETCTSKLLFGIDCPGCGMTRAFIAISQGELFRAWNFNPASFLAYLFVAVQLPWQSYQMYRLWIGQRSVESYWIYVLPLVLAAAMIIQWLCRTFL